jgi:hypothetical protein
MHHDDHLGGFGKIFAIKKTLSVLLNMLGTFHLEHVELSSGKTMFHQVVGDGSST